MWESANKTISLILMLLNGSFVGALAAQRPQWMKRQAIERAAILGARGPSCPAVIIKGVRATLCTYRKHAIPCLHLWHYGHAQAESPRDWEQSSEITTSLRPETVRSVDETCVWCTTKGKKTEKYEKKNYYNLWKQ